MSVRAPVGRLNLADQEYGIGRDLCGIIPNPRLLNRDYNYYVLNASIHSLNVVSTGSTYDAVTVGDIGRHVIPVPPLHEQTAIVRYLYWADRRIRRVIRARRRRIKLLEEYKQVLINQAVTGKIDVCTGKPYLKYKDSGVSWLGKVPEHWEVRRLKHIIQEKLKYGANEAADSVNHDWPRYLRITDFGHDGKLREDTFRSLQPDLARNYLVQAGDILLARSGATVGKCFFVDDTIGTACYAGYLIRVRPHQSLVLPKFLYAFLSSTTFEDWKSAVFIIATIQNVSAEKYGVLRLPIPPLPEQTAIVKFLDNQMEKIDTAISATRREIDLLKELRTRLIADIVTGKLDVREAAAKLPDEPPEKSEPLDEEAAEANKVGHETDQEAIFEESE